MVTLRGILGAEPVVASSEQIAWAFRKRLEAVAAERPLVCLFDDVHWGEETFLDLIEHVADLSRDAPILLLCMSRPELLDRRAGWAGGKVNATNVLLEPLAPQETERLIEGLAQLEQGLRAGILQAAEGNPLFVEEMVALVQESGDGEVTVPPSIQALLAARLDQLAAPERDVLECGAVEGRVFHRGAVQALAPAEPEVAAHLMALVRKDLVRPDRAQLPGEDAFRFRHLLIRDAAYDALPKSIRANLHERFANWLEEHGTPLVELDEILGYHLEQAHRYRGELGRAAAAGSVGVRAATYLSLAGDRAYARGDAPGAVNLLTRAAALVSADPSIRAELLPVLGQALFEVGDLTAADATLEEAIETAEGVGELGLAARARVSRLSLQTQTDPKLDLAWLQRETEAVIERLEQAGDELGLARAWLLMGTVHNFNCQAAELAACARKAFRYAQSCGAEREEADSLFWQAITTWFGPMPAAEGRSLCEQILSDSRGRLLVEGAGRTGLALMDAQQGHFEDARAQIAASRSIYRDLGMRVWFGGTALAEGEIEYLAGDWPTAERVLREGYDLLDALGETGYLSTIAAHLAEAIYRQDRLGEAEHFTRVSEQTAAPGDLASQIRWRKVRATIQAKRGDTASAEAVARQALDLARKTDHFHEEAMALLGLADVLDLAGRPTEAIPLVKEAKALYELKGDVVMTERARARLADLGMAGSN